MHFKFHFPVNSDGFARDSKVDPPEGPPRGRTGSDRARQANASSKDARLRGSTGTASQRSKSSVGSDGRQPSRGRGNPEGPPPEGYARNNQRAPSTTGSKRSLVRSRSIKTRIMSDVPRDFGPFEQIVAIDIEDIDIVNIYEARNIFINNNRVPITVKFYIDTNLLRRYKITSAKVTLENARVDVSVPSPQFVTPVEAIKVRQKFKAAERKYQRSIIDQRYINFENLYNDEEDIEYTVSMSQTNLGNLLSKGPTEKGLRSRQDRLVKDRITAVDNYVKPYESYVNQWSKGRGADPGASINKMPASYSSEGRDSFMRDNVGSSKSIRNIISRGSDVPRTGSGVHANKMGTAAASLFRGEEFKASSNKITYRSKYIPVLVNLILTRPLTTSSVRVRIQLRAQSILANQVVASGSRKIDVTRKVRACSLPIFPPTVSIKSAGSEQFQVTVSQTDVVGSHVAIYGKAFDKSGNSMKKGWTLIRSIPCTTRRGAASVIMSLTDFGFFDTIAIRAVTSNKFGLGSRYSSTTIKNTRDSKGIKGLVHNRETMPCVFAVNSKDGIDVTVRGIETCNQINVFRMQMSTGGVGLLHSRVIKPGNTVVGCRDVRARGGEMYRYYAQYTDLLVGKTMLTSYKDAIIKKVNVTPELEELDIGVESHSTSMGNYPSLNDDSVSILARVTYTNDSLTNIVNILAKSGIEASKSTEIKKISENFNRLFAIKMTRTHVQSGERVSFGYKRVGNNIKNILLGDSEEVRKEIDDSNFGDLIPGDTYIYNLRLHKTNMPELLGAETTAESTPQNPGLELTIFKNPNRRFFKNSLTSRGILPSEAFVQDNRNYGTLASAFSRGYTGIELNYVVKIPESHNNLEKIQVIKQTRQVITLIWTFAGDTQAVDHFVVFENTNMLKVPIGARVSSSVKNVFKYHIIGNGEQYDRTYVVEAYDDSGNLIDTIESDLYSPPAAVSTKIIKRASW